MNCSNDHSKTSDLAGNAAHISYRDWEDGSIVVAAARPCYIALENHFNLRCTRMSKRVLRISVPHKLQVARRRHDHCRAPNTRAIYLWDRDCILKPPSRYCAAIHKVLPGAGLFDHVNGTQNSEMALPSTHSHLTAYPPA